MMWSHGCWILLSCFISISVTRGTTDEGLFTAIAANRIYQNSQYTVWFVGDLNGRSSLPPLSIRISCTLEYGRGREITTNDDFSLGNFTNWSPEQPIRASMYTYSLFRERYKACFVNAVHLTTNEIIDQFAVTLVSASIRSTRVSVFIQMDKPVYKPGDVVRIRLVTLNDRKLPDMSIPLTLTVKDAKKIIIHKVTAFPHTNANGIRKFEFNLSKKPPNLGPWQLIVESGRVKEVRTFVVEKYILPKYLVKVSTSPSYLITGGSKTFTVEIQVSYTYGKMLAGNCSVIMYPAGSKPESGKGNPKLGDLKNGLAFFTFAAPTVPGIYRIEANVTEHKTERWSLGTKSFQVYKTEPFKITWLNPVSTYKNGFPLDIQLAISTTDNLPVSDSLASAVSLSNVYQSVNSNTTVDIEKLTSAIPSNGMVNFRIATPSDSNTRFHSIIVRYKQVSLSLPLPRLFKSPSQLQLNILPPTIPLLKFQSGNTYIFVVEANECVLTLVNYLLYDGVNIIDFKVGIAISKTVDGSPVKRGEMALNLPQGIYSELKIFVFFVHTFSQNGGPDTEEIVSASATLSTNNFIDLQLSKESLEPAENISLRFRTHSGSTIALRAIDQSVLLLSQDPTNVDLDPATVPYNEFWRAQNSLAPSSTSASDFIVDFKINGLEILTNVGGKLAERKQQDNIPKSRRERFIRQAGNDVDRLNVLDYAFHNGEVRTRKEFPEVWLWEEIEARSETTEFQPKVPKVPDTITSWFITAFSINKNSGIAVTSFPKILQVFRPFFITLNIPYSVIKHESFAFKVLVHNYLNETIWTTVTFINDENNYHFVDTVEQTQINATRHIRLDPFTVDVVQFVITPLKLGHWPIHIRALTGSAGDAVIRLLNVISPGETHPTSNVRKIIYSKNKTAVHTERIPTRNRRSLVNRSLKFTGDPFAPILDSKHYSQADKNLVPLPTDCGEQSMVKFYPNILALKYLQAVNKMSPERKKRAIEHLETGYQKQLTYFDTKNGSFQYHCSDTQGSTWLTAFILRCFSGARKYITIDDRVIIKGLGYLIKQQNKETGEFVEYGKNLYPEYYVAFDMAGKGFRRGANKNVFRYGITAYVTLAIAEIYADIKSLPTKMPSKTNRTDIEEGIIKGRKFISSDSSFRESDGYSLAIVTATLHATNHSAMDRFHERLELYAKITDDGNFKHYELNQNISETQTTPITIEITAYALLVQMWRSQESIISSLPIVRWLFSKRNPEGGFISTQDTIVALTALSKYAELTIMEQNDEMDIEILTNNKKLIKYKVSANNSIDIQEFILPADIEWFDVTFKGKGRCSMEYQEFHYKPKKTNDETHFKIKATWTPTAEYSDDILYLKLCVRTVEEEEKTGDAIAKINLPSGYVFDGEQIEKTNWTRPNVVKNIVLEQSGTHAIVYYDFIVQTDTCVTLPVSSLYTVVTRHKPSISVVEYMEPNKNATVLYPVAILKTVCDLCLESKGCDVVSNCV